MSQAGDVTLATYEAAAERYREQDGSPGPPLLAFLDRLARLVGAGTVLELGSGTGRDATYLESHGLRVTRTDATRAFVEMMRSDGYDAQVLDVRFGEFGGPYDAVFANAMLLHLTREEFGDALAEARRAVVDGGLLAFTVKEGDGEAWSTAKLDLPRHFIYWREPAVRAALESAHWTVLSVEHVEGRTEPWLFVLARATPRSGSDHTERQGEQHLTQMEVARATDASGSHSGPSTAPEDRPRAPPKTAAGVSSIAGSVTLGVPDDSAGVTPRWWGSLPRWRCRR